MLAVVAVVAAAGLSVAAWLWCDRRRLARKLREAEAHRLRMQLNPQFFYNALNAISEFGHYGQREADEVLARLSELLRKALDGSDLLEVALRDEAAFIERYLVIQKMLMRDRLQYQLLFDPDVLNACVPGMIIVPLVENALTHGQDKDGVAHLAIKAMCGGGNLIIAVTDAGPGLRSGLEPGAGLSNIRARLAHLYGDAARLKLQEHPDGGLMAQIVIPYREGTPTPGGIRPRG